MFLIWNKWTALLAIIVTAGFGITLFTASASAQEGDPKEPPQEQESADTGDADMEDDAKSVDDLIGEAIGLAREGKYDEAIERVSVLREANPDDDRLPIFLVRLMNARISELIADDNRTEADKYITRAATFAREVVANVEGPEATDIKAFLSSTIYNEACSLALAGKADDAMSRLKEAFEWGYDDFEQVTSDSDLQSISGSEAFTSLIESQKRLLVERLVAETATELAEFESFDFDFQLPDFADKTVSLADYKGKILIVDFWGTWCPPCRAEIPSFVKLKQTYGEKGLDVVGLTYEHGEDEAENVENVKSFVEEFAINYACVLGTEEVMNQVSDFQGYPTTLFIDRTGKVRLQIVGLHSYEKLDSICTALLAENGSDEK
jgi:thiol-disulfide isomerase/thioredoxin